MQKCEERLKELELSMSSMSEELREARMYLNDILTNVDNPMMLKKERLKAIRDLSNDFFHFWGYEGE